MMTEYWPSPEEVVRRFDEDSAENYWYPRDFNKYLPTDHYKEQLFERQVPEELVISAIETGEFYPTEESGIMGFQQAVDGIGVVVIVSGKTREKLTYSALVTTWPYISDSEKAKESEIWNEQWVGKVAEQNLEYLEEVGGDTAAPPELREHMELRERLD